MPTLHLRHFLVILLGLFLAACKETPQIAAPVDGSVHTSAPTEYKLTYKTKPAALPKVTLNGVSVESSFVMAATEAIANGADLASKLKEGKNLLQVDPPLGPKVSFIYDTVGPEVVVLSANAGSPITIQGVAIDAVGTDSLTINGVDVDVASDGTFDAEVASTDIYTFDAVDTLGHASQVQHARQTLLYNPSLSMRVNQSGLDIATNRIISMINGMDLSATVGAAPLYDTTWKGPSGETYGADGFIDDLTLSAQSFNLNLGAGGTSAFDGVISYAHLQLRLQLHNGLLPPTVITIGAEVGPLEFAGDLSAVAMEHQPVITLSNFSFNVGAVTLDSVPDVFNAMLSPMISGIVNLFSGQIAGLVEDKLSSALPGLFAEIIQDSYTISINGLDMAMALQLEDINTTDDSLLITLSGGVTPITSNALIPQPLGPVYTADTLPAAAVGEGDFAVSVNTNVINQTLASAYAVGLTHMNIMGEDIHFSLPRNDTLGDEGATRILVDTQTPPSVKLEEVDGEAATTLSIHGMKIISQLKKNGVYKTQFSASLNAKVGISLSVNAENKLDVVFVNTPMVDITGVSLLDGPELSDSFNDTVNYSIAAGIGQIMEELAKPIASIALPSFACMSFTPGNFSAVGENHSHAAMTGSLAVTSSDCDTAPIDPPKVAYGRGVGTPLTCASDEVYDAGLCYPACRDGYSGVGPVCWKDNASYGRGAGTVASSVCGSNEDMDTGLCYAKCSSGYYGVGPVCWSSQSLSYGRGAGTIPNLIPYECRDGKEMDAGLCYTPCASGYYGVGPVCWLSNASYGRGVGTIPSLACGSGEDLDTGLCYPTCSDGFYGVGPVCWTNEELSYGRGVGAAIHTCPEGKEEDAALCYDVCAAGYDGVGPVCWPE